jgi:hypothetical protein
MARIRPKDTELIKKLRAFNKSYFTVSDLERILGLKKESLYVTLHRLVHSGILVRLRNNAYRLFLDSPDPERAANELYFPSYLSFESALSAHGIHSQVPYTLTFATVRPSKRMFIEETEVIYRHLKKDLFFGYALEDGKYIATPEKALLDELYLMARGKTKIDLAELDYRGIDPLLFEEYAEHFPSYMDDLMNKARRYFGTTPVTLDTRERITWREPMTA